MAILAKVSKLNSAIEKADGKFYARPFVTETMDLSDLSEHMSNHNSPYSKGVIKGLLTDMVSCIKELLLEGKNVKIDDLAIFSVGFISNGGADTWEDWTVAQNIKGVKMKARATGELSNANLNLDASVKKLDPSTLGGAGSGSTSGGSDNSGGSSEDELA